ncbi:MAG: PEP-CTERM sorting domain-containing protein [Planctomycetota bacterium]
MIKNDKHNFIIRRMVLGAMAVVLATASQSGYGQIYDYFDPDVDYNPGYCLLIEQSPIDAGKITPQSGIYNAELDEVVVLRAIARPGYQFVYWLGDVTDPTTNETTILMNSPKIVMAVFERSKFELPIEGGIVSGFGRGGLRGVPGFRPKGGGGASRGGPIIPPPREPPEPPEPLGDEFPVPAEPFPVPENDDEEIPEPATLILLGLGIVPVVVRKAR